MAAHRPPTGSDSGAGSKGTAPCDSRAALATSVDDAAQLRTSTSHHCQPTAPIDRTVSDNIRVPLITRTECFLLESTDRATRTAPPPRPPASEAARLRIDPSGFAFTNRHGQ